MISWQEELELPELEVMPRRSCCASVFQEEVAEVERRITAAKEAEREAQRIAKQAAHAANALAEEEPGAASLLKRAALPASGRELATLAEQIRHLQAARRKLKVTYATWTARLEDIIYRACALTSGLALQIQRDQNSAKDLPLAVQVHIYDLALYTVMSVV